MLLKVFYPEFFLSLCILYILLLNVNLINLIKFNYPLINKEVFSQGLFILISLFFLVFNQQIDIYISNFIFFSDLTSRLLKVIITFFSIILFLFVWKSFLLQNINFFEYFIFYFFSLLSVLLLLNCSDFISVYLIIEIQSLSFYILASFKRTSSFSTESGLKYFIIGSISSSFFLLGSFFCYSCLGTLNLHNLGLLLSFNFSNNFILELFILLGFFFIIITLFLKIAVAPFHFWAPDVYEGAPLGSTLIFSILPKISILTFFIRLLAAFPNINLKLLLLITGLFSVLFGAYFALIQKRLKRFIIYSSISQVGFLILALSIGDFNSIFSIYIFLFVYLLTSLMLWGNIVSFNDFNSTFYTFLKKSENPVFISDLSLFFKRNYLWSISFSLIFFSFLGIPPLSGFFSKVLILLALIANYNFIISFFLVIITIISSFYYLRVVKILFFDNILINNKPYITVYNYLFNIECILFSFISFFILLIFFLPSLLNFYALLLTTNLF